MFKVFGPEYLAVKDTLTIGSKYNFATLCLQVIILIGNKADLEAQRDVTYEEAKQFAEENGKFLT